MSFWPLRRKPKVPPFKLGRKARTFDPKVPHLSTLLAGKTLAPPPASVNYTAGMPSNLGVMLNNSLGDCTCAAWGHAIQVWTFNASQSMQTLPDATIESLYEAVGGYIPGNPSTDQGCVEQEVLSYLVKTGLAGNKLSAFIEVDPGKTDDVKRAIEWGALAYIGFNVPSYLMSGLTAPGSVWDVPGQSGISANANTSIVGGHAVILAGYDANGATVISWGNFYAMTWAFFAQYVDEVYGLADSDWLTSTGKTLGGLTLPQLIAQMKAIKGYASGTAVAQKAEAAKPTDFRRAALTATSASSLAVDANLPWPAGARPVATPLERAPSESDDLARFKGYDAVVMTWTSAEADTLAALFTPGHPVSSWYEYRHDIESYIPLVTGHDAPFNDNSRYMDRYYHSLGLYMPARIGSAKVLCIKSGLHLAYDGPHIPLRKWVTEIAQAVQPKLFITTGTGGGIGESVKLGDVVIAGKVRFDCTTQFKHEKWAKASYEGPQMPGGTTKLLTAALTEPNASRIPGARKQPKIWSGPSAACVTTDFFGFSDSTNFYKLNGLGKVCDMGDAMVAQALQPFKQIRWYSVRNASDPEIANPHHDIKAASKEAETIYSRYGGLTTAASAITTWAMIRAATSH